MYRINCNNLKKQESKFALLFFFNHGWCFHQPFEIEVVGEQTPTTSKNLKIIAICSIALTSAAVAMTTAAEALTTAAEAMTTVTVALTTAAEAMTTAAEALTTAAEAMTTVTVPLMTAAEAMTTAAVVSTIAAYTGAIEQMR